MMDTLLIASAYLLIGACWVSVVDQYIFKNMTDFHKFLSLLLWPLDIFMGGVSR